METARKITAAANNSMDVRAKQRLSLFSLSFYPDVARSGFAARQFNRYVALELMPA